MTAQPQGKRSIKQAAGEKLYSLMFRPGWPRWVLLAAAALVFILVALSLCGGTDYRDDPSALAPRSAQVYMETRDLDSLLRTVAAWRVWKPERRAKGDEQRNQLQVDVAGLIGEKVAGLGTRLPLQWLVDAKQAAYCVNVDEQGGESWGLYLRNDHPADLISDIGVEQGMNVEQVKGTAEQGVVKLTGSGAGELYFGVVGPWLIVSSAPTLPEFALESSRRPAFSLARAELLPKWRHGVVMRGLSNPVYRAEQNKSSAYGILSGWMDPNVRVNFSSKIGRNGLETLFDADQLSERVRGSGLWPLVSILLAILGLIALAIVFATILVMVGWGGWLKTAAMRAGVVPASEPAAAETSAAFREDSGAAKDATPATASAAPEAPVAEPAKVDEPVSAPETVSVPQEEAVTESGTSAAPADENEANADAPRDDTNDSMKN